MKLLSWMSAAALVAVVLWRRNRTPQARPDAGAAQPDGLDRPADSPPARQPNPGPVLDAWSESAAFTAWSMHDPVSATRTDHVAAIPAARTAYVRSGGRTGVWGHLQADPPGATDWPDDRPDDPPAAAG